jgi:hypothetical protein
MLARLRPHLSFANVMATVAVAVALGGTGAAALTIGTRQIRDGAVTTAKLHSGAVTTAKLRNGAVTAAKIAPGALQGSHFAPGELPAGPAGSAGPQGPAGPRGPAGPLSDLVPEGVTLRGSYALGGTATVAGQLEVGSISFGFRVPFVTNVQVVHPGEPGSATCPGSPEDPKAGPEMLCVYESVSVNAGDGLGVYRPYPGGLVGQLPLLEGTTYHGAVLTLVAAAPGEFISAGSWAARPLEVHGDPAFSG